MEGEGSQPEKQFSECERGALAEKTARGGEDFAALVLIITRCLPSRLSNKSTNVDERLTEEEFDGIICKGKIVKAGGCEKCGVAEATPRRNAIMREFEEAAKVEIEISEPV